MINPLLHRLLNTVISVWRHQLLSGLVLVLSILSLNGQAQAQSSFKPLEMQNCFNVMLADRMTSLPLADAEIRPLSFFFSAPLSAGSRKLAFINASCGHHINGEINGFSRALFTLFEENNIPVNSAVINAYDQRDDIKTGAIFLATFNLWHAAFNGKDIHESDGYKTLKSLSEAGNSNATLQLYNFYYKNEKFNVTNTLIDNYFNLAAEQGNNYARNSRSLNTLYYETNEGSVEEKDAYQQLIAQLQNDDTPYERQYFSELCADNKFDGYFTEKLPELTAVACEEANNTIFPIAMIEESKGALSSIITKEKMRNVLDKLITALQHDDKIYFNPVGEFKNRTQALILLSQAVTVFNLNQFYEGEELEEFLVNYKEIMFDEQTLIDVNALPFTISGLLTVNEYIASIDLTPPEIDLLKAYAEVFVNLNENRAQTCSDLSNNKLYRNRLWPDSLPVLSTLQIYSATIEDFEDYSDGEGLLKISGNISMMDPSKMYKTLLMPNSSQSIAGCDIYLSEKSVALFPSELQRSFEIDRIVSFPHYIQITNQSGNTKLEKSILNFNPPASLSWDFFISDKVNINPDLAHFPFKIGDVTTGLQFMYAEVAHNGIWSMLVDEQDYLLPVGSKLETSEQQNNNIQTSFKSMESEDEDLGINITFQSNVDYYLLRIIFPSTVFVFLSVLAVLAPSNKVADLLSEAHLQVSTTVLVALVAYQFIIDNELPKLPYYTDLDVFLYCLLVSSALSIVHNLLPHISSSNTQSFMRVSTTLKYATILIFIFAILDFTVKYFGNV